MHQGRETEQTQQGKKRLHHCYRGVFPCRVMFFLFELVFVRFCGRGGEPEKTKNQGIVLKNSTQMAWNPRPQYSERRVHYHYTTLDHNYHNLPSYWVPSGGLMTTLTGSPPPLNISFILSLAVTINTASNPIFAL